LNSVCLILFISTTRSPGLILDFAEGTAVTVVDVCLFVCLLWLWNIYFLFCCWYEKIVHKSKLLYHKEHWNTRNIEKSC
jgi:hypothetical protein